MPLDQLHEYIADNRHLPNVPSAAEIKEKGLNWSEFQMKMLEEIEELTLYTVQQAKTIVEKDAEIREAGRSSCHTGTYDGRLKQITEVIAQELIFGPPIPCLKLCYSGAPGVRSAFDFAGNVHPLRN